MNMRARIGLLAWSILLLPVATRADDLTGTDQATEQIEPPSGQAQQATQTQIENFKKAFSVCLEAKEYMVRF